MFDVPVDDPLFGKSFPCKCALNELSREHTDRLERYSNLGPLTRLTFDNLQPKGLDSDPDRQRQYKFCYDKAIAYADEPEGWLVLTGPSGCGKTHMAAAIANRCIRQGTPTFWAIVPDLLDHLRATFGPDRDVTYDDLFERVKNAPLLILDDLGTHSATPWAEEKLFQILNHRFNARLATVVTTMDIDALDERLRTRLQSAGLSQELNIKAENFTPFKYIGNLSKSEVETMTFDNFDINGMNAEREEKESLKTALKQAQGFAKLLPDEWLFIWGPIGCGKTHLAASIANYQIAAGKSVFFASVPELLEYLQPAFGSDNKQGKGIGIEEIKKTSLLILDDLSVEATTVRAREKLYQILNYRYNSHLPTVITSIPSSYENFDDRLKSRLANTKIVTEIKIAAPDYRGGREEQANPKSASRKKRK